MKTKLEHSARHVKCFSFRLRTPRAPRPRPTPSAPAKRNREKKRNNLATKTASFEFEILLNAHPTSIAKRSEYLQKRCHFILFYIQWAKIKQLKKGNGQNDLRCPPVFSTKRIGLCWKSAGREGCMGVSERALKFLRAHKFWQER